METPLPCQSSTGHRDTMMFRCVCIGAAEQTRPGPRPRGSWPSNGTAGRIRWWIVRAFVLSPKAEVTHS
jgi:hypothetical protein